MSFSVDDRLSDADEQSIQQELIGFGDQHAPPRNYRPLRLAVHVDGRLVAGLLGSLVWDWLQVDALWVKESARGCRYGTALLDEAERRAREAGCRQARLDTFDFEARPFYEQRGYSVYAELPGFPREHRQFHMRKSLM